MSRFTVEDMQRVRRAVISTLPDDGKLIEKIDTELEILKIRRKARAVRKQRQAA